MKKSKEKIMVFGTFDLIHKGHLNFFKQARKLSKNPYLIVSVARDINVKRIKGKKPQTSEKVRLSKVCNIPLVDKVVLGGKNNYINHILKEKPDIIALGYDQWVYTEGLSEKLALKGLKLDIYKLKAFKPNLYKSSILKKIK